VFSIAMSPNSRQYGLDEFTCEREKNTDFHAPTATCVVVVELADWILKWALPVLHFFKPLVRCADNITFARLGVLSCYPNSNGDEAVFCSLLLFRHLHKKNRAWVFLKVVRKGPASCTKGVLNQMEFCHIASFFEK
jgi:hypothetical protein